MEYNEVVNVKYQVHRSGQENFIYISINFLCNSYFTFSKIMIILGVIPPNAAIVASLNFVSFVVVVLIAVFNVVAPYIVALDDLCFCCSCYCFYRYW